MAEYIDLELAKRYFQNVDAGRVGGSTLLTPEEFAEYLDEIEPADVAPVRHARWLPEIEEFDDDPSVGIRGGFVQTGWKCSACGRYEPEKEPYCNCGAKMDGGEENAPD